MLKRKYNRIFILLNGVNEGLSENINGSCDIEIINGRAKMYAYAGGMGRLKDKPRTVYLISAGLKGSVAIPAGVFENRGTNAVLETTFDPDDIFGSGVSVEDINAAAVWSSEESPVRTVLEGYVSHKVGWLRNLEIFGQEKTAIINETEENTDGGDIHNGDAAKEIERKILEFEKSRAEAQEEIQGKIQDKFEYDEQNDEQNNEQDKIQDEVFDEVCEESKNDEQYNGQGNGQDNGQGNRQVRNMDELKNMSGGPVILNIKDSRKKETKEEADTAGEAETAEKDVLQAAEAMLEEKLSPHDTFRLIAEKFRKELDMLDEMGVLDKSLLLGEGGDKNAAKTPGQDNANSKITKSVKSSKTESIPKTEKTHKTEKLQKAAYNEGLENTDTAEKSNENSKNRSNSAADRSEASDISIPKNEKDILFEKNEKLNVGGGTLWVKADYREMYFIPSAIEELMKPFVRNGARKGSHVIAGKNGDKYYIGVPGKETERVSAEKNGFFDFLSVNGEYGYWIKELENI